MKQLARVFMGLLLAAFMLAGVTTNLVTAQDRAKDVKPAQAAKSEKGRATSKTLLENDKVRVVETHFKPGDVTNVPRFARVVHVLKGGTMLRTYPDGKTEKVELKTGEVMFDEVIAGSGPRWTVKNVGGTDVVTYVVQLK
jgi:hypothetical protein